MRLPPKNKRLLLGPLGLFLAAALALGQWGSAAAPDHPGGASAPAVPSATSPSPSLRPGLSAPPHRSDAATPRRAPRAAAPPITRTPSEQDEIQALKRNSRGEAITSAEALAQLRALEHERAAALVAETAVPIAVTAVPPSTATAGRATPTRRAGPPAVRRAAPSPLRPLAVGPDLPGMPEYVVVGRTYTADCITPPRDAPTVRVRFVDYLRNVLANEWVTTWPAASLDAGAVAVKQFAWHTVVIERKWRDRGYPFDLVDNTCDQFYRDASADPRTDAAIQRTWATVLTRDGGLLPTYYRDTKATCAGRSDCMGQVESAVLAGAGQTYLQILARYYNTGSTHVVDTDTRLPAQLPPVPRPAPRLIPTPATVAAVSPSATPGKPRRTARPAAATPAPAEDAPPAASDLPDAPVEQPTTATGPRRATPTSAPRATATGTDAPTRVPPTPTATPLPPTPTPVPRMPNLVGMGEKQAREALAKLGIYMVIVDYQGRDRLGDLYDTFPAYTVVSHMPQAGAPARAGMLVKLGVRKP